MVRLRQNSLALVGGNQSV